MSTLIDDLIDLRTCNQEFNGAWYIAKPYEFFGFTAFIRRLKDAWRVLTGKSRAYHFYEDTLKKRPKVIHMIEGGKEV